MLVEYVRDEHHRIVGAVVATGPGSVGWSLCHPKQNRFDKRNKLIALMAAAGRASIGTRAVPPDYRAAQIDDIMSRMTTRSYAYFKQEVGCNSNCECSRDQYNSVMLA